MAMLPRTLTDQCAAAGIRRIGVQHHQGREVAGDGPGNAPPFRRRRCARDSFHSPFEEGVWQRRGDRRGTHQTPRSPAPLRDILHSFRYFPQPLVASDIRAPSAIAGVARITSFKSPVPMTSPFSPPSFTTCPSPASLNTIQVSAGDHGAGSEWALQTQLPLHVAVFCISTDQHAGIVNDEHFIPPSRRSWRISGFSRSARHTCSALALPGENAAR